MATTDIFKPGGRGKGGEEEVGTEKMEKGEGPGGWEEGGSEYK